MCNCLTFEALKLNCRLLESIRNDVEEHLYRIDMLIKDLQDIDQSAQQKNANETFFADQLEQQRNNLLKNSHLLYNEKHQINDKIKTLVENLKNINSQDLSESISFQIHHHLLIINNLIKSPRIPVLKDKIQKSKSRKMINPLNKLILVNKKRIAKANFKTTSNQESVRNSYQDLLIFKSTSTSYDHQYCAMGLS